MHPTFPDSAEALHGQLTAAILAGGRGERLGGVDKGLVMLQGRPLAAWVLDRVRSQAGDILIVANRHLPDYAAFGVPVVSDSWPDFRGPLMGFDAAMRASTTDWLLCVPCDAVRLPADLAQRLLAGARRAAAPAAYARSRGDAHYVCCLLSRTLAPALAAAIGGGESAPRRWLGQVGAVAVDIPDDDGQFRWSLNTPADLAAATGGAAPTEACHGRR